MKYQIESSIYGGGKSFERVDCERLIEKYPCLNEFGFTIEENHESRKKWIPVLDENGKRILQEHVGLDTVYRSYLYIRDIEELRNLQSKLDCALIFYDNTIEIYDGYRE